MFVDQILINDRKPRYFKRLPEPAGILFTSLSTEAVDKLPLPALVCRTASRHIDRELPSTTQALQTFLEGQGRGLVPRRARGHLRRCIRIESRWGSLLKMRMRDKVAAAQASVSSC